MRVIKALLEPPVAKNQTRWLLYITGTLNIGAGGKYVSSYAHAGSTLPYHCYAV